MSNTSLLGAYGGLGNAGLQFRNKIINASCLVSQRGDVATANNGVRYGGADRFFVVPIGFTTVSSGTIKKSAFTGATSGFGQWLTGFSCTGAGTVIMGQRIEAQNTFDLNSKQVTFSGNIYQNTGTTVNVDVSIRKADALDDFATSTLVGSISVSAASGAVVPFTLTINLGSSDASNGLAAAVTFTGLSNISNKDFAIGDFQLEAGPVATPFEHRPIGLELQLCQRYYQNSNTTSMSRTIAFGTTGSGQAFFVVPTGVVMRSNASFAFVGTLSFRQGGTDNSITSIAQNDVMGVNLHVLGNMSTSVGNGVAGNLLLYGANNSYSISAEL